MPQDAEQARHWLDAAAEAGEIEAQVRLADLLAQGKQVPRNDSEAFRWYREAGENGHGVAQDYVKAAKLYHHAAELGITLAKRSLGYFYEKGLGVPADRAQALRFFQEAADAGDKDAGEQLTRLRSA